MTLLRSPGDRSALDVLYLFLPLGLSGFVTVVLLSLHGLAELFADQDKRF